ncbi:MAG TPA: DUF2232 domain-containing protein [Nitrospirota bacterium]|nr:DUF2232 domain-containing protein [Nitrospirota bacterium]
MDFRAIFLATIQTIGLYAAGFVIPIVGQVLALFTPVPAIIAWVRNGRREGLAVLCAASVLAFILGGWQAAAIYFFGFGLMALGTAEGMRQNLKAEQIALLGGLLPVVVIGTILSFYFIRIGKNPVIAVETYLRSGIANAAKLYTTMGLTEMSSAVTAVPDKFIHYLVRLIPGIAIATSVVQASFCYGIARSAIARKQIPISVDQPSFALWFAPDAWVWGLIAALALVVFPREVSRLIGWNLSIIFAVVYLAQGTAIVDFYLRKGRVRPFVRGLIIALILALPAIVFVIALGIVDIWADVRKVRGPVLKT